MNASERAEGCAAHPRVSAEFRAVAELFAGRLQPWLERMAQDGGPGQTPDQDGGPGGPPCTRCPLCALLAALRGDRPDVVVRLAEHAVGLVTAVRDLVTPAAEAAPDRDRAGRVSVQHVVVRPAARDEGGASGC